MSARLVVEADGGSRGNPGPAGYGAVVRDADTGEVLVERAGGIGRATNNVAEYRGLIAGLTAVTELAGAGPDGRRTGGVDVGSVEVRMDSKLVVEQMSGRWQVRHPDMKPLAREAAALAAALPSVRYRWIPREQNRAADALANQAMDAQARGLEWSPAEDRAPVAQPEGGNRLPGWMAPPTPPATTLLLRHGQTPLSIERRFSGTGGSDPELTALGLLQAKAAAARLAGTGADAVISSPLRRARQTAELVADALNVPVEVDDDIRETAFGDWEGLTFLEARDRWPAEVEAWLESPDVAPPGGESFAATAARVAAALERLLSRRPAQTVVVVSHVTPIKSLVRQALLASPEVLYRLHLDLASLTTIDWYSDGPAVMRGFNDVAYLAPIDDGTWVGQC